MEEKTSVKKSYKKAPRRKVCVFCQEKVTEIDFKDVNRLKKFVTESGKISSITALSAQMEKLVSVEITARRRDAITSSGGALC